MLNSDKDGFAHSHQISHGPSVCAMCLKVDDADGHARPRREAARHAVPPGGRAGRAGNPGGARARRQPALFRRSEKRARPAVGHRLQRAERSRRATAAPASPRSTTCRSRCTTRRCCRGCCSTIRCSTSPRRRSSTSSIRAASCAARWCRPPTARLRIALNASQSQQTLSSRFLTHYVGSGVQHIAFATDDIVATVQQLRANGVELLSMPENYYDDLEARTDLAAERLDVLRAPQHPLRPRRGGRISPGLHPQPSRTCSSSRSSSAAAYKGFGAVNASIRLAAQAREMQHSGSG